MRRPRAGRIRWAFVAGGVALAAASLGIPRSMAQEPTSTVAAVGGAEAATTSVVATGGGKQGGGQGKGTGKQAKGQGGGGGGAGAKQGGGGGQGASSVGPTVFSAVLGRPTATSVAVNLLSPVETDVAVDVSRVRGSFSARPVSVHLQAGAPAVAELTGLRAGTRHYYRVRTRAAGETAWTTRVDQSFSTQRGRGSTFAFTLHGDSHPERAGKMFDAALYRQTLQHEAAEKPDFHVLMGDDFSLDRFINAGRLSEQAVRGVYAQQRDFLAPLGAAAPLFLANGNHEQAAMTHLDGTETNPAVLAGRTRTSYFALPQPGSFYSVDQEKVPGVGLLADYYAWTWGDALFVVMDPYWHSPSPVDVTTGDDDRAAGNRQRDWWGITIGDSQYKWLESTLRTSKAKYKFVFSHHVMGTGRGGVEMAGLYEWGGKSPNGADEFATKRPGWAMPIHQLFVKYGVSIYFQGHDHLYAHQELDGVTYQEVPNPADATYQVFNGDAYRSGKILPNSGHLRVTVAPSGAKVEYLRSFLPEHASATQKDGAVADTYVVRPR